MRAWLFACDIDNTLIYSRKHPHEGWPCVEWIHGKEQAYMSPETLRLLEGTEAVPLTSRSREQYLRIRWPRPMPLAVTANGADLLVEGAPDEDWRRESDARIAPWRNELERAFAALRPSPRYIRCRLVDEAYLFVYCAPEVDPRREAEGLRRDTGLDVQASGKKIYLLPPPLNKGSALARLKARLMAEHTLAAGDSEMDIPMLRAAQIALIPAALKDKLDEDARCCPEGTLFSEYALSQAQAILGGGRPAEERRLP